MIQIPLRRLPRRNDTSNQMRNVRYSLYLNTYIKVTINFGETNVTLKLGWFPTAEEDSRSGYTKSPFYFCTKQLFVSARICVLFGGEK